MVRDRVCETFLPRSRAILVVHEGEEHFFCSEGCRSRFLAGAVPVR
jgi:YHS domain-containing protein